jgi:muconolactone delta-isomerase
MRTRSLLAILGSVAVGSLLSFPLRADDVYLTNGRSFKGVIAEVGETQVTIRMPVGEIGIPRSQVARVETSESAYAEYLRRKGEIRRAEDKAGAWLELAKWAKANGLAQSAREAALAAAELDPKREGLAPLLRSSGYTLDTQLDRWIPYAEAMRRKGLVHAQGEWITREEYAARERERREAGERRAAAEAERRAKARSEAVLRLAEIQLYKETIRDARPQPQVPAYGLPITWWPGYVYIPPVFPVPPTGPGEPPPPGSGHPGHPGHHDQERTGYGGFEGRQPGSLFPVNAPRSSSSSRH